MPKTKDDAQTIEQLTRRFRELDKEKTRVQAHLDTARERLEELLVEAEQQFGTRDIRELEAQLKQMEEENQKKREKYQHDLDNIEQQLAEIDEKFVDIENEPEDH